MAPAPSPATNTAPRRTGPNCQGTPARARARLAAPSRTGSVGAVIRAGSAVTSSAGATVTSPPAATRPSPRSTSTALATNGPASGATRTRGAAPTQAAK